MHSDRHRPASVACISEFKLPEEDSNAIKAVNTDTLAQFAKDYKLNPELSRDDRHLLLNTLYEYKDCLTRSYKDLKIHQGYKLDIDLKDPTCRSYTDNIDYRKKIQKKQTNKFLN